jgi:O-antigen/teichoic acid export membrane protein
MSFVLSKKYYLNILKNKSIENFLSIGFIQASNVITSLISLPILVQVLGIANFGLISLALAVMMITNIMIDYGFGITGTREIAIHSENKNQLSIIFSEVIFSKLLLAIIACVILFTAVYVFGFFPSDRNILVFSLLIIFAESIFPFWFFHGLQKLKVITYTNFATKVLYLLCLYFFIQNPYQSYLVNFFLGGISFLINVMLLIFIHFRMKIKIILPDHINVFIWLRKNVLLFISNLSSYFSVSGGTIILSFFSNAVTLGMFVLADKIAFVFRIFPTIVIQAVFPQASQLYYKDFSGFLVFIKKIAVYIILISSTMSLLTFVFAEEIINLISKSNFHDSVTYLRVLAFIPFLASLNVINMLIFYVKDHQSLLFKSSLIIFGFMIFFCGIFGFLFGAIGLCYVLIIKEFFAFLLSVYFISKYEKVLFDKFYRKFF